MAKYVSGGGNSTPEGKVFNKMLRGEKLTSQEWSIYRNATEFDDLPF